MLTAYPLAIATLAALSHLTTFSGPSLLPLLPIAVPGFMPMPDWLGDAVRMLLDSDFLTLLSPDQVAVELEAGWLTQVGEPPAELRRTIGVTTRSGWRPTGMQQAFLDRVNLSLS